MTATRSKAMRLIVMLCMAFGLVLSQAATAAAETTWCQDWPYYDGNLHAGRNLTATAGEDFDSIVASIDVPGERGAFMTCDPNADFDNNGAHAYVAIVPSPDTPEYGNPNAIFQIGIARCADIGNATCAGNESVPHFWWAYGGCDSNGYGGGNGASPIPRDLGPANYSTHQFKVARGSSSWYVYLDGVSKGSRTFNNGSEISCWAQDPDVRGQVSSEKWDRGDSVGDPLYLVLYTNITYRYIGSNYINWNPPAGTSCSFITDPSREGCQIFNNSGHGGMRTWTTQP